MQLPIQQLNISAAANIIFRHDGTIMTDMWGTTTFVQITDTTVNDEFRNRWKSLGTKADFCDAAKNAQWLLDIQQKYKDQVSTISRSTGLINNNAAATATPTTTPTDPADETTPTGKRVVKDKTALVQKFIKFFSEFEFTPQVRMINSLANCASANDVRDYVTGYFDLTNNPFAKDVAAKVKSEEFKLLAEEIWGTADRKINKRFEIYYGEPGSGKTTQAIAQYPDAAVVVCHAGMTPDELFRGFDFTTDGKPTFRPCPLRDAMKDGKVVILDEINLLNEDCRRTLQAICDEKTSVTINTDVVEIADGFKVVGTMNLFVNEMCFPLPAPLVDRAETIREFSLTAAKVAKLAF